MVGRQPGGHLGGGVLQGLVGNARPLDQAAQNATTEMTRWLMNGHGLSFEAASVIIGQAADYKIGNMFDPAYTMVCIVPKDVLPKRA